MMYGAYKKWKRVLSGADVVLTADRLVCLHAGEVA